MWLPSTWSSHLGVKVDLILIIIRWVLYIHFLWVSDVGNLYWFFVKRLFVSGVAVGWRLGVHAGGHGLGHHGFGVTPAMSGLPPTVIQGKDYDGYDEEDSGSQHADDDVEEVDFSGGPGIHGDLGEMVGELTARRLDKTPILTFMFQQDFTDLCHLPIAGNLE